jgi:hypothetical protein
MIDVRGATHRMKSDTSPPNGMLPENRPVGSGWPTSTHFKSAI